MFAVALIVGGCSRDGTQELSVDLAESRAVTFSTADGVRLAGRLFGEGDVGVVLSHMLPADQTSWWAFARTMADEGYVVLTFDFRGYCPGGDAGCSSGTRDISEIWLDVLGAVEFLQGQGARRIVLVGASMGGTASLVAAAQPGVDVTAVVTLSAPTSIEGLTADASTLAEITAAKLFVAGNGDPMGAAEAARQLLAQSQPPRRLEIVDSSDHGTDLLNHGQAEYVQTLLLDHLDEWARV
ncbi:MAG: alpha/beta fold hydrolase [Actinomycetota bacterium]